MNKKKNFLICFLFLVIVGAAVNVHLSVEQNQKVPSLQMQSNIKALAEEGEPDGKLDVTCYYTGTVSCPGDVDIKVKYVLTRVPN